MTVVHTFSQGSSLSPQMPLVKGASDVRVPFSSFLESGAADLPLLIQPETQNAQGFEMGLFRVTPGSGGETPTSLPHEQSGLTHEGHVPPAAVPAPTSFSSATPRAISRASSSSPSIEAGLQSDQAVGDTASAETMAPEVEDAQPVASTLAEIRFNDSAAIGTETRFPASLVLSGQPSALNAPHASAALFPNILPVLSTRAALNDLESLAEVHTETMPAETEETSLNENQPMVSVVDGEEGLIIAYSADLQSGLSAQDLQGIAHQISSDFNITSATLAYKAGRVAIGRTSYRGRR